ncbi:hypothetical protein AcW1_003408 [Taiwanofungus camphoratus]|nr:hypothetical protein AcW1_003408 [Antrodia cinnamomea]
MRAHAALKPAGLGCSLTVYRTQSGVSDGTFASVLTLLEDVPRHKIVRAMGDCGLSPAVQGTPSPRPGLCYAIPFT